jgi:hypothetical protein
MKLDFVEEGHRYLVDGRPVPSVTTLISQAGRGVDYSAVPAFVLEQARNRGIHVHAACDLYDQGDLDLDSVVERWRPYVEAWRRFSDEHQPTSLRPELRVYHPGFDYAGTLDLHCLIDGVPTVIDRKTSKSIHPDSYGLQTAAYSLEGMLMAEPDGTLMLLPIVQKRLIVQLCGDGKPRVHACDDPVDYEDWRAVLRLARRTARYAK